ncbi:hypothetical protein [Sulfitobacter sediminilitoris]|uniref:hypothetical protein n=1 Tax=Sulfitobacter sediminilitoris TaxID=2698830 RepID=UPI001953E274|nr:hypothetical protein [Sulfitobacter sediminilitoris]
MTALRRLITKNEIGEYFLDRCFWGQRFFDLFADVLGALICLEPNYSIKSMEVLYDWKREG